MQDNLNVPYLEQVPQRQLAYFLSFIASNILVFCAFRHCPSTLKGIYNLPRPRIIALVLYFDSWIFVFIGGFFQGGAGLDDTRTCNATNLLCITAYIFTKLLIVLFLIEKAYIIGPGLLGIPRLASKLYLFNLLIPILSIAVFGFCLKFRIGRIVGGRCIGGLALEASLFALFYDLTVNIYLTSLFLYPLLRLGRFSSGTTTTTSIPSSASASSSSSTMQTSSTATSPALQSCLRKTLIGAICSTLSSSGNLSIIAATDGHQFGFFCMASCMADVVINTMIVYWLTTSSQDDAFMGSGSCIERERGMEGGPRGARMKGDGCALCEVRRERALALQKRYITETAHADASSRDRDRDRADTLRDSMDTHSSSPSDSDMDVDVDVQREMHLDIAQNDDMNIDLEKNMHLKHNRAIDHDLEKHESDMEYDDVAHIEIIENDAHIEAIKVERGRSRSCLRSGTVPK